MDFAQSYTKSGLENDLHMTDIILNSAVCVYVYTYDVCMCMLYPVLSYQATHCLLIASHPTYLPTIPSSTVT